MRMLLLSLILVSAVQIGGGAFAQTGDAEIAPAGKLRVGMNAANRTLVTRTADGNVSGISVDLGKFIAEKLDIPFEPVIYASPAAYTESFGGGDWDIIVTGRNASAAKMLDFSPDVLLIESVFVAAPGRDFSDAGQVDRPGVRIGVARGTSADVFLSRTLRSAELVRVTSGGADLLSTGKANVFATLTASALAIVEQVPGTKIIPGVFDTVGFAVAMPKGRSSAAQSRLTQVVNEAKTAGIVQKAIDRSELKGIRVAP
jgi:polar amino acid transport system substrate-binding protein